RRRRGNVRRVRVIGRCEGLTTVSSGAAATAVKYPWDRRRKRYLQEEPEMGKHGWLALGVTALLAQALPTHGAEPKYAAPPQPAFASPDGGGAASCPSCAASYAVTGSCGDCPKHGRHGNSCDGGEG